MFQSTSLVTGKVMQDTKCTAMLTIAKCKRMMKEMNFVGSTKKIQEWKSVTFIDMQFERYFDRIMISRCLSCLSSLCRHDDDGRFKACSITRCKCRQRIHSEIKTRLQRLFVMTSSKKDIQGKDRKRVHCFVIAITFQSLKFLFSSLLLFWRSKTRHDGYETRSFLPSREDNDKLQMTIK